MRFHTLFACSVLVCCVAWAQATSQINGTVRDETGAAIPSVQIKATQTATGAIRSVTSAVDGGYVLSNLPLGPYMLEVSKEGFTKFVQTGIVLQVDSNPVVDLVLKVGAVTEQVTVEAAAAQIETRSTGVGQVVDNQRISEMPLNGRQPIELVFLAGMASALTIPEMITKFAPLQKFADAHSLNLEVSVGFGLVFLISLIGCFAGTWLTAPEDEEVLKDFYRRVRPWGFWGPILKKVQQEDPSFQANKDFFRDMFNVVVGIGWQICLVALPIYIVTWRLRTAAITLAIVAVTSIILKFTWYDHLTELEHINQYGGPIKDAPEPVPATN